MPIFKDLKTITRESFKAIDNGIHSLAVMTSEMNAAHEIWFLKEKIALIEEEIQTLLDSGVSVLKLSDQKARLSEIYLLLGTKLKPGEAKALRDRRDRYLNSLEGIRNKQLSKEISTLEKNLSSTTYHSFKDEALDLKVLKNTIRTLLERLPKDPTNERHLLTTKLADVETRSREVEQKRHGEIKSYDDNGDVVAIAKTYDDKKHGAYQEYYPDGALKLEALYQSGTWSGNLEYWRQGGTCVCRTKKSLGNKSYREVFMQSGVKILEITASPDGQKLKAFLWHGVAMATIIQSQPGPLSITLKIWAGITVLLNPKVWTAFWRTAKYKTEREKMIEWDKNLAIFTKLMDRFTEA